MVVCFVEFFSVRTGNTQGGLVFFGHLPINISAHGGCIPVHVDIPTGETTLSESIGYDHFAAVRVAVEMGRHLHCDQLGLDAAFVSKSCAPRQGLERRIQHSPSTRPDRRIQYPPATFRFAEEKFGTALTKAKFRRKDILRGNGMDSRLARGS